MPIWSTACPDWAERLRTGRSIIPPPIYASEAEQALAIFKELRVIDLPGKPTFGECSEQWVFDFVSAIFGAYDSEAGKQLIREFFLLISKKNTKSTIAAGIMLTALILCWREDEEHLILAPTKEVALNSFKPAAGMVRADDELNDLFLVQDHLRTITRRTDGACLKVVAAETDAVSGKKSGKILIDEHWIFGSRANADAMLMEATGGLVSRPEGWVIILSTQSDETPAGVFKEKLDYYRNVRDGKVHDPKSLGVLYEFPPDMIESKAYLKPENFYITNPNLNRSVSAEWIEDKLKPLLNKQDGTLQKFLAKHLNIEIGMALRADRWAGVEHWVKGANKSLRLLEELLKRSNVIVSGIDGGGLDDLLGLALLGRCAETEDWLLWTRGWAHKIALERHSQTAPRLLDFAADGDLVIVEKPGDDVKDVADILCQVKDVGLFPEKQGVGVDANGISDIVNELTKEERGFTADDIVGISQGWRLNGAIKTVERKVAAGRLLHGGTAFMNWVVSHARTVPSGNAVIVTKAASGAGKIDPLMATFDAATLMALNPTASGGKSFWE